MSQSIEEIVSETEHEEKKKGGMGTLLIALGVAVLFLGGAGYMIVSSKKKSEPAVVKKSETKTDMAKSEAASPIDPRLIAAQKSQRPSAPAKAIQPAAPATAQEPKTVEPNTTKATTTTTTAPARPMPKTVRPASSSDLRAWALSIKDEIELDPKRRAFVYNGREYRIGDTIRGIVIEEINENYIRFGTMPFRYNLRFVGEEK